MVSAAHQSIKYRNHKSFEGKKVINCLFLMVWYVTHTVCPIKKFTFRSYGTVSLFNYVHARYAGQLMYLISGLIRKRNRLSMCSTRNYSREFNYTCSMYKYRLFWIRFGRVMSCIQTALQTKHHAEITVSIATNNLGIPCVQW